MWRGRSELAHPRSRRPLAGRALPLHSRDVRLLSERAGCSCDGLLALSWLHRLQAATPAALRCSVPIERPERYLRACERAQVGQ